MKTRSNTALLLAAPLVAVSACNTLLGVQDVHLRDDEGAAAADGGPVGGKDDGAGGSASPGGGEAADAGADGYGGVPGSAGEASGGAAGNAGHAGAATGGAGEAGAGGQGSPGVEPHPCPPIGEEKPVRGPLSLVQFAPHPKSRGRLNVSADGKNAYVTSWGYLTQHFARDTVTGKLTPASSASVYNGEYAALAPSGNVLYVGGANGPQFYAHAIATDGTIATTASQDTSNHVSALDTLVIGETTIFLASGNSIRAIQDGVYDATNRVPGTYDGVRTLTRAGHYMYWAEYANKVAFPNADWKIGRARFECDGSLGPREAFSTGFAPYGVAVCDERQLMYVEHSARSLPDEPGWIDVVDLSDCAENFSSCVPFKTLTHQDISGLADLSGIHISSDCSTLFVSNTTPTGGQLLVLSLTDPRSPELIQTFEQDEEYDGIELSGNLYAWHMTAFDGYLYVPMEFGEGVAVFKSAE